MTPGIPIFAFSIEEVKAVEKIVKNLMSNSRWKGKKLEVEDFRIMAPYNAQVNRLRTVLPDFKIGSVDLFQGQEVPVVIYSMAASSATDAPRGMDFLYSPNRFNVAVSRALSVCFVVGSPKLFEPECKLVDQMAWANAYCRYKELDKDYALI